MTAVAHQVTLFLTSYEVMARYRISYIFYHYGLLALPWCGR